MAASRFGAGGRPPTGLLLDAVSYGEAEKDRSFVFRSDEGEDLEEARLTWQVTPGFPNSEKGYEAWLKATERHGDLTGSSSRTRERNR